MKKILKLLLVLLIVLNFAACEEKEPTPESSLPEETVTSGEEAVSEEEQEFFEVSIVTDENAPLPTIEPDMEWVPLTLITDEDIKMSPDCQEIYDKYISPIESYMPLATEFTESEAAPGIYTYIFLQCKALDKNILGIDSNVDGEESYWVDGDIVESSIARWFYWPPESYRKYFDYDEEKDQYFVPECGGGPTFSYVTGYEKDGNMISIHFSIYGGLSETGEYVVNYKGILKVEQEEVGWKYVSNTRVFMQENVPFFHNDDFTAGVNMAGGELWEWERFHVFKGSKANYITIPKYLGAGFNIDIEENTCLFCAKSGLWIYDMNTAEFRRVITLPSEKEGEYMLDYAQIDEEDRIVITYIPYIEVKDGDTLDSVKERAGEIHIAVLDLHTLEPINALNTGIPVNVYEAGGEIYITVTEKLLEEGYVSIYDRTSDTWKVVDYINRYE